MRCLLARSGAVLAIAQLSAALSAVGLGERPQTTTTTAAPVAQQTAEERAEAAERSRQRAEQLLAEITDRGERQEEAAKRNEEKVALQEAKLAEKRAIQEKRKQAQAQAEAIHREKLQKRQLAKVEASDREHEKEKRKGEHKFEEDEQALEAALQEHAKELEQQNAEHERQRQSERAHVRSELSVSANMAIVQAQQSGSHRAKRGEPLATAMSAVTREDMSALVAALSEGLKGLELPRAADRVAAEIQLAAANFAQSSSELTAAFARESKDPDRDIARLLSKFFNETLNLDEQHHARTSALKKAMFDIMPPKVRDAGKPLAGLLWPSQLRPPAINDTALNLKDTAVCGQVTQFTQAVDGYRANLTKVHRMLNATANLLPKLSSAVPNAPREVGGLFENMLSLGYLELIARTREADKLRAVLDPPLMEKLACSSFASRRSAWGPPAAVVALVASWLGQF